MMSEVSKLCWVLLQPNKFAGSGGGDDDDDDGVKRGFRVYGSLLENLLKISVCLSVCLWICATSDTLNECCLYFITATLWIPIFMKERKKKILSQNW
jgi:hypothetical protein